MDEHPSIFCAGEIFYPGINTHHPNWQFRFLGRKIIKNKLLLNVLNVPLMPFRIVSHLDKFYKNAAENNESAVGFKLMRGHYNLAPKTFKKYLSDKKCIMLIRRNLLHLAVSRIMARSTNSYHITDNSEKPKNIEIYISPKKLEHLFTKLARQNEEIENLKGENTLFIEYEELFDWNKLSTKIAAFLEVERIKLSPVLKEINTKPMEETIKNYQELQTYFSKTEFAIFFK